MVHYLAFIIRLIERKISKIKHLRLNQQALIRNRKGEFVIQRKGFNVFIATILCLSMLLFSPEQVEAKSNVNNEESILIEDEDGVSYYLTEDELVKVVVVEDVSPIRMSNATSNGVNEPIEKSTSVDIAFYTTKVTEDEHDALMSQETRSGILTKQDEAMTYAGKIKATLSVTYPNNTYGLHLCKASGYRVNSPGSVTFCISNNAYYSKIETYAKKWNQCPEIYMYTVGGRGVINAGVSGEVAGKYAVTYCYGNDNFSIMFFSEWQSASDAIKNETVVHEFGHALGLDHTQSENNSISVMRAHGFNGKAYPLSDDIKGIAALY